ncbi:MAG TPA: MliC family protein [Candidatus Paceibacterota bacterium]|nr:MliC family protein [Candidatus Paceibacterota bacterium]
MKKDQVYFLGAALTFFILGMVALWFIDRTYPRREPVIIGGQKDAHGCLGAAGYSWCEARQACIRQWEEYCTATPPKTAVFNCADGKTITANFYPGDDKFVDLVLSDSRKISVPHAMSGSGARYAKDDESFVFWNKGDTAFVTENGTTTFSGCVTKTQ